MGSLLSTNKSADSTERISESHAVCKIEPQSARSLILEEKLTSFLQHMESAPHMKLKETKTYMAILKQTLDFTISKMKEVDECFKTLFQRVFYTGSYYDGLRITSANEFDLNAVLAFPFKKKDLEVIVHKNYPSFAKYRLKKPATVLLGEMTKQYPVKIAELFDEENYLRPNLIRKWLQSVMQRTFGQEICGSGKPPFLKDITVKESGPAWTLLLQLKNGEKIDIDFVPVIEFCYPDWPAGARSRVTVRNDGHHGLWFLVPKPFSKRISAKDPTSEDISRLWRLHFPNIEKELIHDCGLVKPLIKCLKRLRDTQNWKKLASYYLKTFVMWEINRKPKDYWKGKLGKLFLDLLEGLSKAVRDMTIPYLFYSQYNLLNAMNQDEANNIANRIDVIRKKICANPRSVLGFMGCSCEDVLSML